MSTSKFGISPIRFVRQYTNSQKQNKINYVLIMQNLVSGMQSVDWSRSYADLGKVGMPNHDFAGGPYINDAYDAYKMAGQYDSSKMTYVGYAGCAAYRFKVPDSYYGHYQQDVLSIDSIVVPISRDRYLKSGLKIHIVASDSDSPSSDWGVISGTSDATGGDSTVYRSNALLSQESVTYLVDSSPKSELLEVDVSEKAELISTKKYIYVYVSLNDYTDFWTRYNAKEARMYAIEGSAAMSPLEFSFEFTGTCVPDVDPETAATVGNSLFKKSLYGAAGFVGAAAITIGALWYGGTDIDGDGMPDEWASSFEVLRNITSPSERMSYAKDGDFMAYADFKSGLVVASNTTTGVCAPFEYDTAENKYIIIGGACSNLSARVAFPYGDKFGVGTNVVLSTDWKVIGYSRNTDYRLVHFQVYQKFGYEPGVASSDAKRHTKAFSALDKYLLARFLMSNGIGPGEANAAKNANKPTEYTTLVPGVVDYDGDGAPDGLELYMMFGPNAPLLSNNHLSPWNKEDGMTDYDGDGLTMSQEMNSGNSPLNPWMIQSVYGGVMDRFADMYNIRNVGELSLDDDNDGLSNLTEYLISEVFGFGKVSPLSQMTSFGCNDYFRKQGQLYYGEIFQDHDGVDDAWERKYSSYANAEVYDPDRDDDDDGWGNYDEYMAGTHPGKQFDIGVDGLVADEMPIPIVKMDVEYDEAVETSGRIIVMATQSQWQSPTNTRIAADATDATWSFGQDSSGELVEHTRFIGRNPLVSRDYRVGRSTIVEGSFSIAFKALNYEIGEVVNDEFVREKYGKPSDSVWHVDVCDRDGKLYDTNGNDEVGTIDYDNGLVTVDFSNPVLSKYLVVKSETVSTNYISIGVTNNVLKTMTTRMGLSDSQIKFLWKEKAVPVSRKGTFYFSVADSNSQGSHGWLRKGKYTFIVFDDIDGNGKFTAGEPLGVATDVDVGWNNASFSVRMTAESPITARISLWEEVASDRNEIAFNPSNMINIVKSLEDDDKVRVRVVRYGIDDMFAYQSGSYVSGTNRTFEQQVVLDKYFNRNGRTFINEADFLGDDQFDIDWGTMMSTNQNSGFMTGAVINQYGGPLGKKIGSWGTGPKGAGLKVTNMTYLVVIGEGATLFSGFGDTNTVINALQYTICRRFETVRHLPVAESQGYVHAARPTFRWSIPDEEKWASRFGSTYTAFQLQIRDSDEQIVYDSGKRKAAREDKDGFFKWDADAPCMSSLNQCGNYSWRVAMFNAKYETVMTTNNVEGGYSNWAPFSMVANAQQEMNDNGYSSIRAAVKYAGPSSVSDQYADLSSVTGKIHAQAFATPDFSGVPVSSAVVTNALTDASDARPNVTMVGIPANGTYYVRAYIDTNGNGVKDAWESWGSSKCEISLDESMPTAPVADIWIEDCDINRNCLPDSWEYTMFGSLTNASVKSAGATILTPQVVSSARNNRANLPKCLNGTSLTIFENGVYGASLLGWGDANGVITFRDLNDSVQNSIDIVNNNFLVRSVSTSFGSVVMTINTDVAENISGQFVNKYFFVTPGQSRAITVKVYRKNSYIDAEWTLLRTVTTQVGCTDRIKNIPISGMSSSSGIYKVVVE